MIEHRPYQALGRFENDWLTARHHFSFGHYHDPRRMGHGALLVWNDDTIAPGRGFDLHGHRDMEIITYVREGAITHQDHLGNQGRTVAGDIQVMSAGKGILHSEHNWEDSETKIFQIWIKTQEKALPPRWETRRFPEAERIGRLVPLASGEAGLDGALPIHQLATVYGASLRAGQTLGHQIPNGRSAYLVVAEGKISADEVAAEEGDGLAIADQAEIEIEASQDSVLLMVETV